MAKKTKYGSVKRFGPRYGHTLKARLGKIEALQRKTYKCPYCSYEKVKQEAVGIFVCKKCGAKFASKAYTVTKPTPIRVANEEL